MSLTRFRNPFFDPMDTWDMTPWGEHERGLNRLFPSLEDMDMGFTPSIDVRETDKDIIVCSELPGLKKEDIKLELKDGCLEISGKRESRTEDKDAKWHRIETKRGQFLRRVALPKRSRRKRYFRFS